jgi:hypothetical protein
MTENSIAITKITQLILSRVITVVHSNTNNKHIIAVNGQET